MKRTTSQNSALHLFCTQLSESLNMAGLEMKVVLKETTEIWWTPTSVKKYLWAPIQKAMYGTDSTTQLDKLGEIDKIHEVLMRNLGEKKELEYIPFPSFESGNESTYLLEKKGERSEYPENNLSDEDNEF